MAAPVPRGAENEIADPATSKANVIDKAPPIIAKHGGRLLGRTNEITVLRAADPPLKRFVLIGFDTAQHAKDWYHSDDMKSITGYNEQHRKGRAFVVEAASR